MTTDSAAPDPAPILDLLEAFRRSKTMFAAIALGVFDRLATGSAALDELARDLRADADALQRLLDACVYLGLLQCEAGHYGNTPTASAYLTSTSPRRLTGYARYSNTALWQLWAHLEDAVREGTNRWQQTFGWDGPIFDHFFRTPADLREFLMGMQGQGLISSPAVVAAFDLHRFHRLVDLGGGTGHLSIAACRRYPELHAVVFDMPGTQNLAGELVAATEVANRVELHAGDFFADELPEADLYAMGRIVHDWSEAKIDRLLQKIHDRLPEGGALLLAEKLLNDDRAGPAQAVFQSLNMLVCTEGKERTLAEYAELLRRAGFANVEGQRTGAPMDAVLATKAPRTPGRS
jgi:acetylserotonin O-methyltransferase